MRLMQSHCLFVCLSNSPPSPLPSSHQLLTINFFQADLKETQNSFKSVKCTRVLWKSVGGPEERSYQFPYRRSQFWLNSVGEQQRAATLGIAVTPYDAYHPLKVEELESLGWEFRAASGEALLGTWQYFRGGETEVWHPCDILDFSCCPCLSPKIDILNWCSHWRCEGAECC